MSKTHLFDLDDKIAFVSGASRGIGEAIAHLLAQQGAHVIVSSRKLEGCQQVADAQQLAGLIKADLALARRNSPPAELQVAAYRQVREQAGFLEHVAELAAVGGHLDVARVVLPAFAIDHQAAARRRLQPGHAAQQRGLARARGAKQGRHAAAGQRQVGIKDKVAILGMGCSKFGERWDKDEDQLMLEAYEEAMGQHE